MDPLAFHGEALAVAQRVVDDIDRAQFALPTPCDEWNVRQVFEVLHERFAAMSRNLKSFAGEQPAPGGATAADRFAAFAGRRA